MLIRDPIHGDISLGRLEAAVLDCAEVQRLRGIKQLGTAHFVYPGAVHTRFDHSLGACAAAHCIVACLRADGVDVSRDLEELVGVGALLHDVTHVPFGHTLEDERRLFPRHDKGTRLTTLLDAALGAALARLGVRDAVAGLLGAGARCSSAATSYRPPPSAPSAAPISCSAITSRAASAAPPRRNSPARSAFLGRRSSSTAPP